MPINVLLCRWADGWREVVNQASIDKFGRREAMLGLGGLQSPAEVDRVAGMQLAIFGDSRTAVAADLMWADTTDRPYRAFGVSDTITVPAYGGGMISQRVRAMTGAEDDNGEVTYSPELGDLILEEQERTLQAIKKMADGTLEGESPVAMPASAIKSTRKFYGSAPFPLSNALRIETGGPTMGWNGTSGRYGGGNGAYMLTSFQITVPGSTADDGVNTRFELHNHNGDSADNLCAGINLGFFHAAGTFNGSIYSPTVMIGNGWEIEIIGGGQAVGPFTVVAYFAQAGTSVVLPWTVL